ncbi:MAG: hypothetical protein WEA04_02025 [Candidatus Andersenbacteria bacterium]
MRKSRDLDEREKGIDADYNWALEDLVVRRQYAGQVVAVHARKVWGAGRDHRQAVERALNEPNCPDRSSLAIVVVPEGEFST